MQTTEAREERIHRIIETATEGLEEEFRRCFTKMSQDNAASIAHYIHSMKYEANLSDNYRRNLIRMLSIFSRFCKNKPLKSMIREDLLCFLDNYRKPESVDPMHKWIGTYNVFRTYLVRFFKWLYYPDISPNARPKPAVIENIGMLKRKEISIYKPTDLWTEEDDALFLKYCPNKRDRCYHAVSRDSSCRPHEILKLKVRDIVFKTSGNYQYAEILVNGKTGSRHIPLINSIPFVKDYLDYEHPQPGNPNAPFICGLLKSLGRPIGASRIRGIYDNYKKEYFPKLMENPNVLPEDKQKIRDLLKKPWNPYIRRHSALTEKSLNPKMAHVLNQHAGWVQGSTMAQKYTHYFGNESSISILEAYGIIRKDNQLSDTLRPKQCPNCSEPNKPDSRFCAKCRMVLTYDAYSETLENQLEKDREVHSMREELKSIRSEMDDFLEILKLAKSKNGRVGKDRTMLDENGRITFGYVDNSNKIVEVKIPLDQTEIHEKREEELNSN